MERAHSHGTLRFAEAEDLLAPISSATVARLLRELCATGLLVRDGALGYRPGDRARGWTSQDERVPGAVRAEVDRLGAQLACTVVLWAVRGPSLRWRYRYLDEHSPGLSGRGAIRPIELPVIGAGLLMDEAELSNLAALRDQAARTPLAPGDTAIRRLVAGIRRDRLYDDRACFYPGSHRLGVLVGHGSELLSLACTAQRLRSAAQREEAVAALRATAGRLAR